ncbi:Glutamyl-tRNA synthetase [hydrothermal vent metagenome]|uniref:glutamate--tRNA ligase n=1 Tax=hydrothermal vent metagenome TaxID=652676 RepID=A0A3B1A0M3_9ZZZZ
MTVRTRFAPSPTGYLHIGGARTALFSWLYARKHGGKFILRIEDTDRERSTEESVNAILEGMNWLGLNYDEGPFYQTHRFDRYNEVIKKLLDEGKAYHCYCSKDELETMRNEQMARKEKPRYDGRCRHRSQAVAGVEPVVRFKTPLEGQIIVDDLIRGKIAFQNNELDDLIIARSDGTPTYNLTVVVDDLDMQMTHVIRGDDHINNSPRQLHIFEALGGELPVFAHVPMILGEDGKRLSKRHGAVGVMQYRDDGYLPEAVINYLVRLGWSHGDQEIFSLDELVSLFNVEQVNNSAAALNISKLLWLNQHYIKTLDPAYIANQLSFHLGNLDVDPTESGPELVAVVIAQRERAKTLVEMAESSLFFYKDFDDFDPKAAKKNLNVKTSLALTNLLTAYTTLESWHKQAIHTVIEDVSAAMELKMGKVAQPLRVAVSGGAVSPPIDITLELLGKQKTIERIQKALTFIKNHQDS